jgi:3-deoxy-D-manno-octulosonic-acid transferase
MFWIYSFIYTIALLFLFIPQYLKRPKEYRRRWLREKLGYVPQLRQAIWIHAVSVGEVAASLTLLKRLREEYPAVPVMLSTITDTGQKIAIERAPSGTTVVYLPFDIGLALKRSLKRVSPVAFITIETEIWPNIIRVFSRRGIPVIMLNGRISEKSARGYRKIAFFMKDVFRYVKAFGMQSETDAQRLMEIGAAEDRITVTGNFKFDMGINPAVPSWTAALKGPVIVAGSTHKGEEELILSAFRENLSKVPTLKLILAPRHPERFAEAGEAVITIGLPLLKRSLLEKGNSDLSKFDHGVILLDTVGELSAVYSVADIAVIGKSFIGFGGQNPLEPAFWGKAIICGPHMENFPFIREFYSEGAAFEVEAAGLAKKMKELLGSPRRAAEAGKKARELYRKNSGAVGRAMEVIRQCMPDSSKKGEE